MVTQKESKTIRISQKVYNFIDTKALRGSESFDEILRRLLKIK